MLYLAHLSGPRGLALDAFGDGESEVLLEERPVVAVVDRLRVENELLAHQVEERPQRLDRGGDQPPLDPRDRRLGGPSSRRELALRQPVPTPCITEEFPAGHWLNISDVTYAIAWRGPI